MEDLTIKINIFAFGFEFKKQNVHYSNFAIRAEVF